MRIFYNAMIIFAQKHFANQQAGLYTLFIRVGIYLRASLSILAGIVRWAFPILLDALIVLVGLYFIKEYWASNIKGMASYYAPQYMTVNVPLYISISFSNSICSSMDDVAVNLDLRTRHKNASHEP